MPHSAHDATSNHAEVDHVDMWSEAQYLWSMLVEYLALVQIVVKHTQDNATQQYKKILVGTSFAKHLDQLNKSLVVTLVHCLCKVAIVLVIFKS